MDNRRNVGFAVGLAARRRASYHAVSSRVRMVVATMSWLLIPLFLPSLTVHAGSEPAQSSAPVSSTTGQSADAPPEAAVQSETERNGNDPNPVQGPALSVPREVIDMLDQRKQNLDRREAALRGAEERLLVLKAELERILEKQERLTAAQKQKEADSQKREQDRKLSREKAAADSRNQQQTQLAKIYESMPAEEAAASLERMPERKAIEVLRILKSKSAGAILAAVRPERAARLTEQLLAAP
jgi:flagellar motility protein MotE (MotC chaperone)